jgi:prophage maintenance system killer protein
MDELTVAGIESLHLKGMQESGGDSRVLSEANLHQMVFRANLITDCVKRAAFVFWYLCAFPAFREGNARTARTTAELVLASGGFRIRGADEGIKGLADGIIACNTDPEEVEEWLSKHVQEYSWH